MTRQDRKAIRRELGLGERCFIIGEVAQTHDGSLGLAHAFVDAIANSGADAVKFQTHIAAAESTAAESWRVRFSRQDESRLAYWKRMEFTEEQWIGLREHANSRGLAFISSAFSMEAVELLERVGVAAWKVASGEVNNPMLLDRMAATRKPFLLSTGMSTIADIGQAVDRIKAMQVPVAVMQCTSIYPTPAEKVGLNMIDTFRRKFDCAVGLSDHSGTPYAGIAAAALGIDVLEVHVALSREMFGPDVPASVTTEELRHLVAGVREVENIMDHPVDKDALAEELGPMRALFGKSVVARHDLRAGTVLSEADVAVKKPGTGIPASRLGELLGRELLRDIGRDELLQDADLK